MEVGQHGLLTPHVNKRTARKQTATPVCVRVAAATTRHPPEVAPLARACLLGWPTAQCTEVGLLGARGQPAPKPVVWP